MLILAGVLAMNPWVRGVDRRTPFERQVDTYLMKIQEELMPEKAKMVVAINMDTGEYVLGEDSGKAWHSFRKRWPGKGFYMCRVDGTPSTRM